MTAGNRLQWDAFCDDYIRNAQAQLAEATVAEICGTFNLIDDLIKPNNVRRITRQ